VDVIEPNMRVVLEEEFIPQIMANDRIEKWAHYERFERKFLGQERVKTSTVPSRERVRSPTIVYLSGALALRLWPTIFAKSNSIKHFKRPIGARARSSQSNLSTRLQTPSGVIGFTTSSEKFPRRPIRQKTNLSRSKLATWNSSVHGIWPVLSASASGMPWKNS